MQTGLQSVTSRHLLPCWSFASAQLQQGGRGSLLATRHIGHPKRRLAEDARDRIMKHSWHVSAVRAEPMKAHQDADLQADGTPLCLPKDDPATSYSRQVPARGNDGNPGPRHRAQPPGRIRDKRRSQRVPRRMAGKAKTAALFGS